MEDGCADRLHAEIKGDKKDDGDELAPDKLRPCARIVIRQCPRFVKKKADPRGDGIGEEKWPFVRIHEGGESRENERREDLERQFRRERIRIERSAYEDEAGVRDKKLSYRVAVIM